MQANTATDGAATPASKPTAYVSELEFISYAAQLTERIGLLEGRADDLERETDKDRRISLLMERIAKLELT